MQIRNSPLLEHAFKNFNNEEYWKLLIDFEDWAKNDPEVFDKDKSKGYLRNVSIAFLLMLITIEEPLSLPLIIELHDLAFHNKSIDAAYLGLWAFSTSGLSKRSFTYKGLQELCYKIDHDNVGLNFYLDIISKRGQHYSKRLEGATPSMVAKILTEPNFQKQIVQVNYKYDSLDLVKKGVNVERVVEVSNGYIDSYENEIKAAANDEDKKLFAIAKFIKNIHQYHPHADGNGRTFIFLILNKLLIVNHLLPTAAEDPYRFSAYSTEELVKDIKEGQARVTKMLRSSHKSGDLIGYLLKKINLSEDEIKSLYASEDLLNEYSESFQGAYKNKDNQQIYKIISTVPSIQQISFLEKEAKDSIYNFQEASDLKLLTDGLLTLKYYGQGKNEFLLKIIIAKPSAINFIKKSLSMLDIEVLNQISRDELWMNFIVYLASLYTEDEALEKFKFAVKDAKMLHKVEVRDLDQYIIMSAQQHITKELGGSATSLQTGIVNASDAEHGWNLINVFRILKQNKLLLKEIGKEGLDKKTLLDLPELRNRYIKSPEYTKTFLHVMDLLKQHNLQNEPKLVRACVRDPYEANELVQAIIADHNNAKKLIDNFTLQTYNKDQIDNAIEAIEVYVAYPSIRLGLFSSIFNSAEGTHRATAYLNFLDLLNDNQYLEKKIILYAILINEKGKTLHEVILKALGYSNNAIVTLPKFELAEDALGKSLHAELGGNFQTILKNFIVPLNEYATYNPFIETANDKKRHAAEYKKLVEFLPQISTFKEQKAEPQPALRSLKS